MTILIAAACDVLRGKAWPHGGYSSGLPALPHAGGRIIVVTVPKTDQQGYGWAIVAEVVFFALAGFFLWRAYQDLDFNRHAVETVARVRSISACEGPYDEGPPRSCHVSMTYATSDGRELAVDDRVNVADDEIVDGSSVRIRYDARDPSRFMLDEPTPIPMAIYGVGSLLLAAVFAKAAMRVLRRTRRRSQPGAWPDGLG